MSRHAAGGPGVLIVVGLLVLLLVVSVIDMIISVRTKAALNTTCPPVIVPRTLPCEAIPLRYIEDEPVCADKLLHAMNITSSHILPLGDMLGWANASRPSFQVRIWHSPAVRKLSDAGVR
jgi:hypothetical protein